LPPSILKPRKQGFTIPVDAWLRGPLGETAAALFSSDAFAARGIVSPEKALLLLERHRRGTHNLGHRIWSLMVLEVWARIWLDGQSHLSSLDQIIKD
jgi:asparagine synthase (glutamine-hydrolysing)